MHMISQPLPTPTSNIPSLMQQHIPPPSNFDPRPSSNLHNQISPSSCGRGDPPLSERLSHMIQTPTNHDPRLQQNNSFRNQNSEPEGHRFIPHAQEPPPPSTFKQESSYNNNTNSNFQDRKPDINIPHPPSQLPFNQPPPVFPQPALAFPPRKKAINLN